jgi:hypothetical protein
MQDLDEIVGTKGLALLDYRHELQGKADADPKLAGDIDQALGKVHSLLGEIEKDPAREMFYLSDIDSLLNPFFAGQPELNRKLLPPNETATPKSGEKKDEPKNPNPLKEFKNRVTLWLQNNQADKSKPKQNK